MPAEPPLLVDVHGVDEAQVHRITVAGEMDTSSAPTLHEAVAEVLHRQRPRRIEIDMRSVIFIDSAGIRTLLTCHAEAGRADCPLTLVDPHPMVHRVLEITGLLDHFNLTRLDP